MQQVASTIQREHEQHPDESFVFGISGRWGEGKTYFLHDLQDVLKPEADVVWLNPWKHGSDRAAFMRSLVRELAGKRSWKGRLRDWWLVLQGRPARAERLESDSSRQRVNVTALLGVLLAISLVYAAYKLLLPANLQVEVSRWRTGLLLLGIPIILTAVGGTLVGQSVSRSVATTDGFSDLLKSLLDDRDMKRSKKIVVFVDDLDRVSAQMARDVLDSLRTFFDQPALSFVVAGDHTVLERILGRELLPECALPEQLDEGRRFLKKVFNVYWRLPLPVADEFEGLLAGLLQDRRDSLSRYLDDHEIARLGELLSQYFEKNLRAVSRFVDEFIFTMEAVDVRLQTAKNDVGLADLKQHPLLVVRVLMIQENCSPFFEAVLRDPRILDQIEVGIDRKEPEPLDQWIEAHEDDLAERQQRFLARFIYEAPRFFENSVLTVSGLEPFLYLAADGSEDNRGVAPEDLARLVAMGNAPEVARVLAASGAKRIAAASQALSSQYEAGLEDPELMSQMLTVVRALQGLPVHHPAHAAFSPLVSTEQATRVLAATSAEEYVEIFLAWQLWLDSDPENVNPDDLVPVFPYRGAQALDALTAALDSESAVDRFGHFGSLVTANWARALYEESHHLGAVAFNRLKAVLDHDVLKKSVAEIESALVDDLVDEQLNPNAKVAILDLLTCATEGGAERAKSAVLEAVELQKSTTWDWALSVADTGSNPWTREQIEAAVVEAVAKCDSPEALVAACRFASSRLTTMIDAMWKRLVDAKVELLANTLPSFVEDRSFAPLAPSDALARGLFSVLKADVKRHADPGARAAAIRLMRRGLWLWDNVVAKPDRSGISGLRSYRRSQAVEAAVTEVLSSWSS